MLTLLHTSPVHVATFDALRDRLAPGAVLTHVVREDLLERARAHGLSDEIATETTTLIRQADGPVLCTCTTLGEVAESAGAIRIDQPMMQAAAETGGTVLMAYCLDSTVAPSQAILQAEMARAGNSSDIALLLCAGAWPHFEAGEIDQFNSRIARAIRASVTPDLSCIVLAQASMAGTAELLGNLDLPVLSSPEPALKHALGLS